MYFVVVFICIYSGYLRAIKQIKMFARRIYDRKLFDGAIVKTISNKMVGDTKNEQTLSTPALLDETENYIVHNPPPPTCDQRNIIAS